MPKRSTHPILLDNILRLEISDLKRLGYLEPGRSSGTINWSRNGNKIATIHINVTIDYTELDYNYNGKPRNYRIPFVTVPSNLNKGEVLYFLCPKTNKRCRVLYQVGGYFLHREAFQHCMYEKQTQSKRNRDKFRLIEIVFRTDKIYEEFNKKYFKRTYAGMGTKKYVKLMQKIYRTNNVSHEQMRSLLP